MLSNPNNLRGGHEHLIQAAQQVINAGAEPEKVEKFMSELAPMYQTPLKLQKQSMSMADSAPVEKQVGLIGRVTDGHRYAVGKGLLQAGFGDGDRSGSRYASSNNVLIGVADKGYNVTSKDGPGTGIKDDICGPYRERSAEVGHITGTGALGVSADLVGLIVCKSLDPAKSAVPKHLSRSGLVDFE